MKNEKVTIWNDPDFLKRHRRWLDGGVAVMSFLLAADAALLEGSPSWQVVFGVLIASIGCAGLLQDTRGRVRSFWVFLVLLAVVLAVVLLLLVQMKLHFSG